MITLVAVTIIVEGVAIMYSQPGLELLFSHRSSHAGTRPIR